MPSEWIRPAACESGSCVEYRTVGDKVFVRNSSALTDNGMLEFTVAEWDTFVAGLVSERTAAERVARHTLAAENARLRQDLDKARAVIAANPSWSGYLGTVDDAALRRYAEELAAENRTLIAKVEVLRHRDRRTQAVVDAAVAWRRMAHRRGLFSRESVELWDAVDAYENGPTEAPETPLPAEQPPVVPVDGLEAQGGAQRAPASDPLGSPPGSGERARIAAEKLPTVGQWPGTRSPRVWNAGDPEPEGVEKVVDRIGDHWQRRAEAGHRWFVDDEGLDVVGLTWRELLMYWAPLTEVLPGPATGGILPPGTRFLAEPDPVEHWVPFAALPEPAAPTAADLQAARDQTRADASAMLTVTLDNTDGRFVPTDPLTPVTFGTCTCGHCRVAREVYAAANPEAARAGEAQEGPCDCAGCAYDECDPPTQDRTEGLDAAIEAAFTAAFPGLPDGMTLAEARRRIEAAVRAASPLIERAALHAAADAWEAHPWPSTFRETFPLWLRDRATRTETS